MNHDPFIRAVFRFGVFELCNLARSLASGDVRQFRVDVELPDRWIDQHVGCLAGLHFDRNARLVVAAPVFVRTGSRLEDEVPSLVHYADPLGIA